jgi:integrase
MISTTDIGTTLAISPAQFTPTVPTSLAELLVRIDRRTGTQEGMLHAVAARFVEYVGLTGEAVSIEMLHDQKESFISHLKAGKYKTSSVKSYRNYLNILLRRAHEAGWVRPKKVLPSEWQVIADVMPRRAQRSILSFAVRIGRGPGTLCEDDLAAWRQERVKAGRSLKDAEGDCSRFRTAIARTGLSSQLPLIRPRNKHYGVALADMHPDLRQEVEELMDWKVSEFQLDRPFGARIRPISAKRLTNLFCRITGFVQKIAHKPEVTSLSDLISRDHIAGFATWGRNTRKMKGQSLSSGLGMVYAALRHNPRYKALDLSWFKSIIDQMPHESQSTIDQRKAKKYISYQEAEQIPGRIRAQRMKTKAPNPRTLALHARNELLMLWLLILAWRQRNIRDCRVTGDNPNLFEAPISPFSMATRPSWVAEQERASPGTSFWQIHFDPSETKTKNEVNAFLPSELVPLLEEYLSIHRPVLVGKSDPGTLFVSSTGRPMKVGQMRSLVTKLASAHAGVPVTPHLYRDIVAYEWLKTHPEDYLTVSKLLWHRNLNTTLRIYGRRFDESTGVARMDDWRSSRSKKAA